MPNERFVASVFIQIRSSKIKIIIVFLIETGIFFGDEMFKRMTKVIQEKVKAAASCLKREYREEKIEELLRRREGLSRKRKGGGWEGGSKKKRRKIPK